MNWVMCLATMLGCAAAMGAGELYPKGKVFPFAGYSGKAEEQKRVGYTVFGPVYGDTEKQAKALGEAKAAGLPFICKIEIPMHFTAKDPKQTLHLSDEEIRKQIGQQVKRFVDDQAVCWWYLAPEEMRSWKADEMRYLKVASETIRANDPQQRPIWMYDPNHRDAGGMAVTGKYLDIIGKGCYVNLCGYMDDRVWVRWGVEQEMQAIAKLAKQRKAWPFALVMPELCKDPPEDRVKDIPRWTRHDVYLGLMSGAKGVAIWSMFPRAGVKKTHAQWYEAYGKVARELTGQHGDDGLGQVFLFGQRTHTLSVKQTEGEKEAA